MLDFLMHLKRGLLAIAKNKGVRGKFHLSGYRVLPQQIDQVREKTHGTPVTGFRRGGAVGYGI
jgi:hypothetical protein